jgi:hypothetical protein
MATESEILQSLDLGASKAILNNDSNSPLAELLVTLTQSVVEELKSSMEKRKINTTSRGLSQSVKPTNVNVNGSSVSVGISMAFYWKFVNYGVNGTEINRGAPNWGSSPSSGKTFLDSIKEWIPQRGLSLPSQFDDFEEFAFAIMANVKKHGKEGRPFFEDVINKSLVAKLEAPISKVLGRAIQVTIIAPWQ